MSSARPWPAAALRKCCHARLPGRACQVWMSSGPCSGRPSTRPMSSLCTVVSTSNASRTVSRRRSKSATRRSTGLTFHAVDAIVLPMGTAACRPRPRSPIAADRSWCGSLWCCLPMSTCPDHFRLSGRVGIPGSLTGDRGPNTRRWVAAFWALIRRLPVLGRGLRSTLWRAGRRSQPGRGDSDHGRARLRAGDRLAHPASAAGAVSSHGGTTRAA